MQNYFGHFYFGELKPYKSKYCSNFVLFLACSWRTHPLILRFCLARELSEIKGTQTLGVLQYLSCLKVKSSGSNCGFQLLGFTDASQVSQQHLTERYRQLVRQYHPDKVHAVTDAERRQAEQRFIAIQQAYETLSVIRRRRADRTEL